MTKPAYRSVLRPGLFAGQLHWVTGGGSGIGRCVAHELASLGATVVLSGRSVDKLERVAAEIVEDGGRAVTRAFVPFEVQIMDEAAYDATQAGAAAHQAYRVRQRLAVCKRVFAWHADVVAPT